MVLGGAVELELELMSDCICITYYMMAQSHSLDRDYLCLEITLRKCHQKSVPTWVLGGAVDLELE